MNKNNNELPKKNILSTQIDLEKFRKATDEEKAQQDVMSESTTFFKDGMRRLLKNPPDDHRCADDRALRL